MLLVSVEMVLVLPYVLALLHNNNTCSQSNRCSDVCVRASLCMDGCTQVLEVIHFHRVVAHSYIDCAGEVFDSILLVYSRKRLKSVSDGKHIWCNLAVIWNCVDTSHPLSTTETCGAT